MYRYWRIFNNVITRDPKISNVYIGVILFIAITIILICLQIIGIASTWFLNTEYDFKTGACKGPWFCNNEFSDQCGETYCAHCSGRDMIGLIACTAVGIITCVVSIITLIPLCFFVFVLLPFLWRSLFWDFGFLYIFSETMGNFRTNNNRRRNCRTKKKRIIPT